MRNLLSALIGLALAVAALKYMNDNPSNRDWTHTRKGYGSMSTYSFSSDLAPEIPGPEVDDTALRFAHIMGRVGDPGLAGTSPVRQIGNRYTWKAGNNREVTVTSKTCKDGSECLSRIAVRWVELEPKPKPKLASRKKEESSSNVTFTTKAFPACRSEQWWNDLVKFSAAEDKGSFEAYFKAGRCLMMKAGQTVTVTEWPGVFSGHFEFVLQGNRYWTGREGIDTHR